MSIPHFDLPVVLQFPELPTHLQKVTSNLQKIATEAGEALSAPAQRVVNAPGKMLRPTLLLTAAQAEGYVIDDALICLATSVELVHIGSLVHDDIIDQAILRRQQPSIQAEEGRDIALLLGDYFLARACQMASGVSATAGADVANVITELCAGEALELTHRYKTDNTQNGQWRIIEQKTASLLSLACRFGIAAQGHAGRYTDFGVHFGRAFQLLDDVLDVIAIPGVLGKPVGQDLREGIYTMPITLALAGPHAKQLQKLLGRKTTVDVAKIATILQQTQAITKTIQLAEQEVSQAEHILQHQAPQLAKLPASYLSYVLLYLISPQYAATLSQ